MSRLDLDHSDGGNKSGGEGTSSSVESASATSSNWWWSEGWSLLWWWSIGWSWLLRALLNGRVVDLADSDILGLVDVLGIVLDVGDIVGDTRDGESLDLVLGLENRSWDIDSLDIVFVLVDRCDDWDLGDDGLDNVVLVGGRDTSQLLAKFQKQ